MRRYLRDLRENKGYSQSEMAKKLNMSQQRYNFIENGKRQKNISLDLIMNISAILKISFKKLAEMEKEYKDELEKENKVG